MAWYLPKDYVAVSTRIEEYHKEHTEWMSINTTFELQWDIAIFKAVVITKKWTFTGSSFWRLGKEKAFEKLETVAVWRALAFAWYHTTSGIASREEMDNFEQGVASLTLDDYITLIKEDNNPDHIRVLYKQAVSELSLNQEDNILIGICQKQVDRLQNPWKYNTLPTI